MGVGGQVQVGGSGGNRWRAGQGRSLPDRPHRPQSGDSIPKAAGRSDAHTLLAGPQRFKDRSPDSGSPSPEQAPPPQLLTSSPPHPPTPTRHLPPGSSLSPASALPRRPSARPPSPPSPPPIPLPHPFPSLPSPSLPSLPFPSLSLPHAPTFPLSGTDHAGRRWSRPSPAGRDAAGHLLPQGTRSPDPPPSPLIPRPRRSPAPSPSALLLSPLPAEVSGLSVCQVSGAVRTRAAGPAREQERARVGAASGPVPAAPTAAARAVQVGSPRGAGAELGVGAAGKGGPEHRRGGRGEAGC